MRYVFSAEAIANVEEKTGEKFTLLPCPHCGRDTISDGALATLNYMRRESPRRGGYMFECARPAFDSGIYKDAQISELLMAGLIKPHSDPDKGWVVCGAA